MKTSRTDETRTAPLHPVSSFHCAGQGLRDKNGTQNDSTKSAFKKFELSFGQSILFISNSKLDTIRSKTSIIVPTSAILFFTELRPSRTMRIPVFFNLPTESKQFLVNGQLVNEKANPSFGTGLEFRCFGFKIAEQARLEMEARWPALFSAKVFSGSPRCWPIVSA
jgi:hypothetical protein